MSRSSPIGALAALLLLAACGEPLAPIVRFTVRPAYLCEDMPDQEVRFDGGGSLAWDGGPADGHHYSWSFSLAPSEITSGSLQEDRLIALFDGKAPVRVRLQVADPEGVAASQTAILGITQGQLHDCSSGCAAHETCAAVGGRAVCVDAATCASPEDCGDCLRCVDDDAGVPRCLP